MELNPIALQFMFDETLFHFNNETFISTSNKKYTGDNKSNITLISKQKFTPADFELLIKILGALKFSLDDVALYIPNNDEDYKQLLIDLNPKHIILFGINPFEIGLRETVINVYDIEQLSNYSILQAEKFSFYHTDALKKKALWFALQKLFNK